MNEKFSMTRGLNFSQIIIGIHEFFQKCFNPTRYTQSSEIKLQNVKKKKKFCFLLPLLVSQSCPTLFDPMSCSLPGSSLHGISQSRILEWVAISFSRGLPNPGIKWDLLSCRQILYHLSHQGSPTFVLFYATSL